MSRRTALTEPAWLRWTLIALALGFLGLFLVLPLAVVGHEALRKGWAVYGAALVDPMALHAVKLTLIVAVCSVAVNAVAGVAAAWLLTRFAFRGKGLLLTLIDLPLAVSPVVAGLLFILLFGAQGWFGPWLTGHGLRIIFALPGIILATLFITLPYVVRELIPLMEAQGCEEEEAARVLGAGGWTMFRRITLPAIRWGLLYGIVLCAARALGEFGAVSVVSGHIRGQTNTLPLHIEILYSEYEFAAAFACASLLALLALLTLAAKKFVDWRMERGPAAPPTSHLPPPTGAP